MTRVEVEIENRLGLHARAAARFVHLANKFQSQITVARDGARVDGKSILGLLTLAAGRGTRLVLCADGGDETDAVAGLVQLIHDRFGEEE